MFFYIMLICKMNLKILLRTFLNIFIFTINRMMIVYNPYVNCLQFPIYVFFFLLVFSGFSSPAPPAATSADGTGSGAGFCHFRGCRRYIGQGGIVTFKKHKYKILKMIGWKQGILQDKPERQERIRRTAPTRSGRTAGRDSPKRFR